MVTFKARNVKAISKAAKNNQNHPSTVGCPKKQEILIFYEHYPPCEADWCSE